MTLHVYSANQGDTRNAARRPRLFLEWRSDAESAHSTHDILLEHGRSLVLPRVDVDRLSGVAVTFDASADSESPGFYIRGGKNGETSSWRRIDRPLAVDWDWCEIRVEALCDPVPAGGVFEAEIRDTWVTSGPEESQRVSWTFLAPSGREQAVLANYVGDHRWRVTFVPWDLGRWHYWWTQEFTGAPHYSAKGCFDVVAADVGCVERALEQLLTEIAASELPAGDRRVAQYGLRFNRLQRALMRLQTPETFKMSAGEPDGGEVGEILDQVRFRLSNERPKSTRLSP